MQNDPVNLVDPTGLMLSDIGVMQTLDPEEARIEDHRSLRMLQISVNSDYAKNNGGTVSYSGNHASFRSHAQNTQQQWLASAIQQGIDDGSTFTGAAPIEDNASASSHAGSESYALAQVVIWSGTWELGPITRFGHVSYVIDAVSYSWQKYKDPKTGKQEYYALSARQYIEDKLQSGATGVGYVLDFGSIEANRKFKSLLLSAYDGIGGYNIVTNNCGHAFRRAINAMNLPGVPKNKEIRPSQHQKFIDTYLQPYIRRVYNYPQPEIARR